MSVQTCAKRSPSLLLATLLIGPTLFGASASPAGAAEWPYSVPVEQSQTRRAYLWVPPDCTRVRGLIVGLQNMLERLMFEDPAIRRAAADAGLGIVLIAPVSETNQEKLNHKFGPEAWETLGRTLTDLAKESGYSEIQDAPLLLTAHSAATPFVWGAAASGPSRVFAILPYKGWFTDHCTPDVPALHISSEYGEARGPNWGETYLSDRKEILRLRGEGERCLIGEFVDIGPGHYGWNPDTVKVIGMFIRKAVAARIPDDAPLDRPVPLRPIDPRSGWLIDPAKLGTPEANPVPYDRWTGDPTKAFWYFDEEMARAVNDFMVAGLAKKPQVIAFVVDGVPVPRDKGGIADLDPKLMDDGVSFLVAATFLDRSPTPRLHGGAAVGHAPGPILFKASSGFLKQTGPDTFRIWLGRGGVEEQGAPWDPWIIAYHPGDSEYRRADKPAHPAFYVINKGGKPQTIDFPRIDNPSPVAKTLKLRASSDAGMPVQFFVVSGPAELKGDDTLELLPIPPRSRFPFRVMVGAYQWGRPIEPKVQSAGPVFREFFIERLSK